MWLELPHVARQWCRQVAKMLDGLGGMVVDVTLTSACTNSIIPAMGAPLPLLGSFVRGAQQAKLDTDIRASPSLSTLSI
jgi:hypothetical protein